MSLSLLDRERAGTTTETEGVCGLRGEFVCGLACACDPQGAMDCRRHGVKLMAPDRATGPRAPKSGPRHMARDVLAGETPAIIPTWVERKPSRSPADPDPDA